MLEKPLVKAKRKRTPRTPEQKIWYAEYIRDWTKGKRRRSANTDTPEIIEARRLAQNEARLTKNLSEYKLEKYRESHRKLNLKKHYGMSQDEYNQMEKLQGGTCAICKKPSRLIYNKKRDEWNREKLCVDHNHKTGKIRELLCTRCNKILGQMEDSPELLEISAKYLRRHNENN